MLSQSYFRSLFRQMFRKSFVEYVNGLRVAKACELIRSRPDLRIIDICHESGFNNVNYFNRLFHEATGLSPLAYRKAAGSVAGPEPKGSSRR
jgi:AraC-like DNA-binding protein